MDSQSDSGQSSCQSSCENIEDHWKSTSRHSFEKWTY